MANDTENRMRQQETQPSPSLGRAQGSVPTMTLLTNDTGRGPSTPSVIRQQSLSGVDWMSKEMLNPLQVETSL